MEGGKNVHSPGVKTPTGSSFKKEEPDSTGLLPNCLEFFSYGLIYFMRWIRIARFRCIAVLLQPINECHLIETSLNLCYGASFCPVMSDRLQCLYLKLALAFQHFIMLSQSLKHFHHAFTMSESFSSCFHNKCILFSSCINNQVNLQIMLSVEVHDSFLEDLP